MGLKYVINGGKREQNIVQHYTIVLKLSQDIKLMM